MSFNQNKMDKIDLTIELFGAFREYGREIELTLSKGASCTDVKQALADKLGSNASGLIKDSALADEKRVLSEEDQIRDQKKLAILPPVCGG